MIALSWIATFLLVFWAVACLRLSLRVSSFVFALVFLVFSLAGGFSTVVLVLVWLIFAGVVIPLNVPSLRRSLISERAFCVFRRVMPSISQTERDALEAGTVWWDGELFSGRPEWRTLLAYPKPRLSDEEQAFIDGPVDELCRMLNDWEITEQYHDLPPEVWQFIKDKGFFGMIIPKQYGGLEFSALAHSDVIVKLSSRSISAAVTVMVPNSLGPAELLLHYGSEQQKEYYLPRLARGEEIPCFALTGPDAGSDAGSMPDLGIVCRGEFEGKEVVGIKLNWEKRYITLGPVATLLGLAFKLYDPDHLLGEQKDIGITLALIPTDTAGVTIGNRHAPLSMVFQNGPNQGEDVFIPLDWVIGGQEQVGNGWRMLMESLAAGRSISLPALSAGGGKLACRATGAYARIRKQFNTAIGKFEGVEEALARIVGNTYQIEAARSMTAGAVDLGEKPSVVSAIAKYNLTNMMRNVINDAMDVQGGSAICLGPSNIIGRVYQAIPISITVEGANILTRSLITFGQGAIRCHPYVLEEMTAVTDSDESRARINFDRALFGHVGFTLSNFARTLWLGLSGARLVVVPGGKRTRRYFQQLTRMSTAFALVSDISMLMLGGALKRKEKLSGRLADILSQLYLASAVLKRYQDEGRPLVDLPLVRWSCDESLYAIQESFDSLLRNFPNRAVALLLRFLIFPFGRRFRPADDLLGHQIAGVILNPSEIRDRLTKGVFTCRDSNEAIGRIEVALDSVIAAEQVEKRLSAAVRSGMVVKADLDTMLAQAVTDAILSEDDAQLVRDAAAARRAVIMVDDFPQDYWSNK